MSLVLDLQTGSPMNEETVRQLDAGMERQLARVRAEQDRGLQRVGWKVAMNVPAVQKQLGLDGWVVGALPAEGVLDEPVFRTPADSKIHIEAEIAIRLGTSLPSLASTEEAVECIEGFAPAIEIVDYGLPTDGGLAGISAHSFFHAGSWICGTLGSFCPIAPEFPVVFRNDEKVADAVPELALNDPAPIALGTAALLERYGEHLNGGDWILCGSLIQPVQAAPGDVFTIDFGPLGRSELRIEDGA